MSFLTQGLSGEFLFGGHHPSPLNSEPHVGMSQTRVHLHPSIRAQVSFLVPKPSFWTVFCHLEKRAGPFVIVLTWRRFDLRSTIKNSGTLQNPLKHPVQRSTHLNHADTANSCGFLVPWISPYVL